MNSNKLYKPLLVACLCAFATISCTLSTLTTEWYVSTTGDDGNSCSSVADPCRTIAAAIDKASAGGLIHVAPGVYAEDNIMIDKNLLILGDDEPTTIIDAGGGSPVFQVNATGTSNFALSEMTMRNGEVAFDINASAGVSLSNVTIQDFTAPVDAGIINNDGTLEIFDGTLRNIDVPGSFSPSLSDVVGAIENHGFLEIRNSNVELIQGHAIFSRPGASAVVFNVIFDAIKRVAVYNFGGDLSLGSSTFENIGIGSSGGGSGLVNSTDTASAIVVNTTFRDSIFGMQNINGAQATIEKSTFSSNEQGIIASDAPGLLKLSNVTISGNSIEGLAVTGSSRASLHNVTVTGNFDGLVLDSGGRISLTNTLVTESSRGNCLNRSGTFTSNGYNIDDDGSCGLTGAGDLSGVAVPLLPLADNGGATRTHALDPSVPNPAIVGGNPGGCLDPDGGLLTEDQRGEPRPVGGRCDVGAYELTVVTVLLEDAESEMVTAVPTLDTGPLGMMVTINSDSLCWEGPGEAYPVVSAVQSGVLVELLGIGLEPGWLIVDNPRYPGVACWLPVENADVDPELDLGGLTQFPIPPLPEVPDKPTPPAAPSNLFVSNEVCSQTEYTITLNWSDNADNEDGYRVYHDGQLISTLGPDATSYQYSVPSSSAATYAVEAFNAAGKSAQITVVEDGCLV